MYTPCSYYVLTASEVYWICSVGMVLALLLAGACSPVISREHCIGPCELLIPGLYRVASDEVT